MQKLKITWTFGNFDHPGNMNQKLKSIVQDYVKNYESTTEGEEYGLEESVGFHTIEDAKLCEDYIEVSGYKEVTKSYLQDFTIRVPLSDLADADSCALDNLLRNESKENCEK